MLLDRVAGRRRRHKFPLRRLGEGSGVVKHMLVLWGVPGFNPNVPSSPEPSFKALKILLLQFQLLAD